MGTRIRFNLAARPESLSKSKTTQLQRGSFKPGSHTGPSSKNGGHTIARLALTFPFALLVFLSPNQIPGALLLRMQFVKLFVSVLCFEVDRLFFFSMCFFVLTFSPRRFVCETRLRQRGAAGPAEGADGLGAQGLDRGVERLRRRAGGGAPRNSSAAWVQVKWVSGWHIHLGLPTLTLTQL